MKICTSYFYQIRHFTPNIIPVSTARFDPSWYHKYSDQSTLFVDKRGVLNGLRFEPFVPNDQCCVLCKGAASCSDTPSTCEFLQEYSKQLSTLEYVDVISALSSLSDKVSTLLHFKEEPVLALIVYEAPTNLCSERFPLQEWFSSNGHYIKEFMEKG